MHQTYVNRFSHGFTSAILFIEGESREEFNLLLADLHHEFQPATPYEQILLEKIAQNHWLSLRAYRLQSIALNDSLKTGVIPKDLGLLIRYHQSSDRALFRARKELLTVQKERKKSEIGFDSQKPSKPAEPPTQEPVFESLDHELHHMMNQLATPEAAKAEARIEEILALMLAA